MEHTGCEYDVCVRPDKLQRCSENDHYRSVRVYVRVCVHDCADLTDVFMMHILPKMMNSI